MNFYYIERYEEIEETEEGQKTSSLAGFKVINIPSCCSKGENHRHFYEMFRATAQQDCYVNVENFDVALLEQNSINLLSMIISCFLKL